METGDYTHTHTHTHTQCFFGGIIQFIQISVKVMSLFSHGLDLWGSDGSMG